MSVFGILETLFIEPLKFAFEIIFSLALRFTGHPGIAIIALSLIMNILLLPLYKRADKIQEEARDTEEKLKDGVAHIKKTFSGNERMMILQTYYRQNNYKPSQAMNGSVSLLLEIPFFMAAYQFLSNLEIFNEASFGPIQNMGAPDGMLVIGGIVINLLPILMTAVNVISSAIYLKGFPLKTKIQLYAMAGFFLIFLYESPACLVFYWTLNNVFSLVKNIVEKIEHRKLILNVFLSLVGVFLIYYILFVYDRHSIARTVLFVFAGLAFQLPSAFSVIIKNREFNKIEYKTDKKFFFLCCLLITVLIGLLIPSALIASAPQDFIDTSYYFNPIIYIIHTLLMAIGMFVVWLGVFYKLADIKAKVIFEGLIWLLAGIMIVNYMFFGTEMGIISANLIYEHGLAITGKEALFNVMVMVAVSVILALFIWKFKQKLIIVILIALATITGMSLMNINTINKSVKTLDIYMEKVRATPSYNLSKDGQNVLVIMLDRAMGEYVPYIINEKPHLKESFDGFTYYNNVVSFGGHTNFGSPALMGGYEYTPVELNKRDDESLADKHNEALKVLPVLF